MSLYILAGLYISIALVIFFCVVPFLAGADEASSKLEKGNFNLAAVIVVMCMPMIFVPRWLTAITWPVFVGLTLVWYGLVITFIAGGCVIFPFYMLWVYGKKALLALTQHGDDPLTKYFQNLGKTFMGGKE